MRKTELGITVAIAAMSIVGCSPPPATQEKPQGASGTPAVVEPATGTPAQPGPSDATREGAPLAEGKPREIPGALKDLKEKLQPQGATAPTASPPQGGGAVSKGPDPQIPGAEKLLESATKLATALAAALQKGDMAEAETLCIREADLGKVLSPSYVPIIGGGIPAQNHAALEHLISGLKGKNWSAEVRTGKLARAPERGPFLGGLALLSGSILRLTSEGVTLEAHLDELVLVGDDWRVFRLSAP